MSECKQCERAVRQEGEGAMCFNCYLEKTTELPTAEEIENDDYSAYRVAKMSLRIAVLEAKLAELREGLRVRRIAELEADNGRLKMEKAEQYQMAQHYRAALQEIRDRTPANRYKEWPHHHWYLGTATRAINHNMAVLQERLE